MKPDERDPIPAVLLRLDGFQRGWWVPNPAPPSIRFRRQVSPGRHEEIRFALREIENGIAWYIEF